MPTLGLTTSACRSRRWHRWLNLLETSYLLVRLPAYAVNLGAAAPSGAHLENLVLHDLIAWRDARVDRAELAYCAYLHTFRQEYGRKARAGLLLHTFSTLLVVINEIGFEPMYRVKHAEKLIYSPDPSTPTGSAGPKA